jgi:hypothetical protein
VERGAALNLSGMPHRRRSDRHYSSYTPCRATFVCGERPFDASLTGHALATFFVGCPRLVPGHRHLVRRRGGDALMLDRSPRGSSLARVGPAGGRALAGTPLISHASHHDPLSKPGERLLVVVAALGTPAHGAPAAPPRNRGSPDTYSVAGSFHSYSPPERE